MEKLKNALKTLGIKNKHITVCKHDFATVDVYVNDKKFGTWDMIKNTFVD